jgi:RecA-family ATPase
MSFEFDPSGLEKLQQRYDVSKMSNLMKKKMAAIKWAVQDLLPEGLAILSGPPKIGKSWFSFLLCLAVCSGGYVFGRFQTQKSTVLMLALEDNERRLQDRAKKITNESIPDNFYYHCQWRKLDRGGLDDLRAFLEDHPDCRLVVIDTIQKVKPHASNRGNAYEQDYQIYGPLQQLALDYRCCILLIHHNRKSASKNPDDSLEMISGSTGVTGSVDTILMLQRARMGDMATLSLTGRDVSETVFLCVSILNSVAGR